MKRTISVLCLMSCLVLFFTSAAIAKTVNANSVWPASNHLSKGLEEYAARVKEATGGKLNIVVQSGGALGFKGPELLKAVRDGLVPISDILIPGVAGDEYLMGITTLPFLVRSVEEGKLFLDIARPYFDDLLQKNWNQKILFYGPWPPAGLWGKNKITSVDDLKGLKTRTYDKNGALVMEALNATPYPLPFSEVYSSLATGLIDSVVTSATTAVDAKFWEVLKYYAPVGVTYGPDFTTINLKLFNSLDSDTQKILMDIAKELEKEMFVAFNGVEARNAQMCIDKGMVIIEPDESFMKDLKERTLSIREQWLEKAPAEAKTILEEFEKQRVKK